MRGCFSATVSLVDYFMAFPAYAGMFLAEAYDGYELPGFPRVCGDVSIDLNRLILLRQLSPRMRGCFSFYSASVLSDSAFPAYAGMFPDTKIFKSQTKSFPRVCGDVSGEQKNPTDSTELSPRMRGCF